MLTLALPTFNPLHYAKRLKEAGVPDSQAEAEAEALNDVLAAQTRAVSDLGNQFKALAADAKRDATQRVTQGDIAEVRGALKSDIAEVRNELKGDIVELRNELHAVRNELKSDIAEVRNELKGDIAEVRGELKGDIAEVRGDIKLLKWMLGILIAGVFTTAAAVVPLAFKAYFGA